MIRSTRCKNNGFLRFNCLMLWPNHFWFITKMSVTLIIDNHVKFCLPSVLWFYLHSGGCQEENLIFTWMLRATHFRRRPFTAAIATSGLLPLSQTLSLMDRFSCPSTLFWRCSRKDASSSPLKLLFSAAFASNVHRHHHGGLPQLGYLFVNCQLSSFRSQKGERVSARELPQRWKRWSKRWWNSLPWLREYVSSCLRIKNTWSSLHCAAVKLKHFAAINTK